MFIGREVELESLNKSYGKDTFQFPVIYGRRRVGKTTLINEFCNDKKCIYFVAVQSTAKENLEILSAQILKTIAPDAPQNPFRSFREAFEYVFERAETERIILAIDEYPYLANSDMAVSSILQAAIDKFQSNSKLFLILCGSSMSFMEEQVLGYTSPLYGRRTAQYKILPFDYYTSSEMLSGFTNIEKITLYSVTGGIPEYLSRVDNNLSMRENICELFFTPSGRFFEEPINLLKQELKNPETYSAIITAIAGRSSRINEVSTKVGIETSQCSKMLSTLISLGIIRKEHPIIEYKSRKSIYLLDDWMFVFWHRFIHPELSRINTGFGEEVYDEMLSKHIDSHVGRAFEDCAKQYMWRALKEKSLPFSFNKIGRWWGNDPVMRREEEIDFIALSNNSATFGECKWKKERIGNDILEDIIRKSMLFSGFDKVYYILFSKSGFSETLHKRAGDQSNIMLVSVDDMFKICR
ncbi:MAG: ATP-binding protein [Oscillospiraceae bacterium]|jgi:AAA+ ATPase superfamily predicted ATPase|nr:ATP-binding protein [Oscillospiraceae bacterium]